MRHFILGFKNSEYVKNFSILLSGNIVSQLIPIFLSPIIARLYAIERFGELALLLGISSLISIGATMQFELAIVLPDSDEDAAGLLVLSLLILTATTILSLLIFPFRNQLSIWLNSDYLRNGLVFVPALVFLTSLYRTFNFWAIRRKMYKTLSMRQIGQTATQSVSKIMLAFFGFLNNGLILGAIFGLFTSTSILVFQILKVDYKLIIRNAKYKHIKNLSLKYSNFPKYSLPHGYSDVIMRDGIIFVISHFYGSTVLGLYSFTNSILKKPLGFIGNSLRSVFYKRAVELKNNPFDLWEFTKSNLFYQSVAGMVIFSPVLFWGESIFTFIFGQKWATAGVYAQYMILWVLYIFLVSPFSSLPNILNKQKNFFIISLFLNLGILNLILVSGIFNVDFKLALGMISLLCLSAYFGLSIWFKAIIYKSNNE